MYHMHVHTHCSRPSPRPWRAEVCAERDRHPEDEGAAVQHGLGRWLPGALKLLGSLSGSAAPEGLRLRGQGALRALGP